MDVEDQPLNESVPIDYQFIRVLFGILAVIVTLVIYAIVRRGKSARKHILLMGPCDSGKTLIFVKLVHRIHAETHTSMKENISDFPTDKGLLKLVDIPGYERLRDKFFDKYKVMAHSILYVVDSVNVQKEIRDVAEYLYNILADNEILGKIASLVVVCNKQDLPLAKGSTPIKLLLEKELNTLRKTKSSQLEFVNSAGKQSLSLGKADKDFTFDDLICKVEFVETCSREEGDEEGNGLQTLEDTINSL